MGGKHVGLYTLYSELRTSRMDILPFALEGSLGEGEQEERTLIIAPLLAPASASSP